MISKDRHIHGRFQPRAFDRIRVEEDGSASGIIGCKAPLPVSLQTMLELRSAAGPHKESLMRVALPAVMPYFSTAPKGQEVVAVCKACAQICDVLRDAPWPYFHLTLPQALKGLPDGLSVRQLERFADSMWALGRKAGDILLFNIEAQRAILNGMLPGEALTQHPGFQPAPNDTSLSRVLIKSPAEVRKCIADVRGVARQSTTAFAAIPALESIAAAARLAATDEPDEIWKDILQMAGATLNLIRHYRGFPIYNPIISLDFRLETMALALDVLEGRGDSGQYSANKHSLEEEEGSPRIWRQTQEYWADRYLSARCRSRDYSRMTHLLSVSPAYRRLVDLQAPGESIGEVIEYFIAQGLLDNYDSGLSDEAPDSNCVARTVDTLIREGSAPILNKLPNELWSAAQEEHLEFFRRALRPNQRKIFNTPICVSMGEPRPYIPDRYNYGRFSTYDKLLPLRVGTWLSEQTSNPFLSKPPIEIWDGIEALVRQRTVPMDGVDSRRGIEDAFPLDQLKAVYDRRGSRLITVSYADKLASFALVQSGRRNLLPETIRKIEKAREWGHDYGENIAWVYLATADRELTRTLLENGIDAYAWLTRIYMDVLIAEEIKAVYGKTRIFPVPNASILDHRRVGADFIPVQEESDGYQHRVVLLAAYDRPPQELLRTDKAIRSELWSMNDPETGWYSNVTDLYPFISAPAYALKQQFLESRK